MAKTFVGFGFGPIQSGLFLYEAHASGNFSRFVISEVDASVVEAVRKSGGRYRVNIARRDRIDEREVAGVEIYDPADAAGREAVAAAVAESDEIITALPSVRFYDAGPASVARLISQGLSRRKRPFPTVIYAAENHNHAAELLACAVLQHASQETLSGVEFLNTVIAKMSGVISDCPTISRMNLATLTPGLPRAVLVEEFNRILISRIHLPGYRRGIGCFVEKDDLLPFEEAKLYGHNAVHALIAYLADAEGLETIAEAGRDPWIMSTARAAFIDESGAALVARHAGLGEPLFTPEGYRLYADDLLERMTRPNLHDLVSRVGRDHLRKLAYDDRLFGTMRLALQYGVTPTNLSLGAAACVLSLIRRQGERPAPVPHLPPDAPSLTRDSLAAFLTALWGDKADPLAPRLIDLTWSALPRLIPS